VAASILVHRKVVLTAYKLCSARARRDLVNDRVEALAKNAGSSVSEGGEMGQAIKKPIAYPSAVALTAVRYVPQTLCFISRTYAPTQSVDLSKQRSRVSATPRSDLSNSYYAWQTDTLDIEACRDKYVHFGVQRHIPVSHCTRTFDCI